MEMHYVEIIIFSLYHFVQIGHNREDKLKVVTLAHIFKNITKYNKPKKN